MEESTAGHSWPSCLVLYKLTFGHGAKALGAMMFRRGTMTFEHGAMPFCHGAMTFCHGEITCGQGAMTFEHAIFCH